MNECDLRARIAELEGRVAELEGEKRTTLSALVEAVPICNILWGSAPAPYYHKQRSSTWSLFVALAKEVNTQEHSFNCRAETWNGVYTECIRAYPKVKRLEDISKGNMAITAEMIEKMVEIYNVYYKQLHPTVMCRRIDGGIQSCRVSDS